MIMLVLLLMLRHFHWGVINEFKPITPGVTVIMLRCLSSFVLVFSSLMSTPAIALPKISGEKILFRYFRDSIVLVLLIIFHRLIDVPVLISCGIFQTVPKTYVSWLATEVADNIISSFL